MRIHESRGSVKKAYFETGTGLLMRKAGPGFGDPEKWPPSTPGPEDAASR